MLSTADYAEGFVGSFAVNNYARSGPSECTDTTPVPDNQVYSCSLVYPALVAGIAWNNVSNEIELDGTLAEGSYELCVEGVFGSDLYFTDAST